jgi:hypothetical protein
MSRRDRTRLIAALMIAPLAVAVPVLSTRYGEAAFLSRNLDVLIIFIVAPYVAAFWLFLGTANKSRK